MTDPAAIDRALFGASGRARIQHEFEAAADDHDASAMAAYMKDHFEFFGIKAPERRRILKPWIRAAKHITTDDTAIVLDFADACWAEPEREFQLSAVDVLRVVAPHLAAGDLGRVRALIETKSWWDTVDLLAAWVVGPMVANHPELAAVMDEWIDDSDRWIARSAILHQLGFKESTDADRLFRYCDRRGADRQFFIRKALGWALRQYARTDPDAVQHYVSANEASLSGLTKREALKHLS